MVATALIWPALGVGAGALALLIEDIGNMQRRAVERETLAAQFVPEDLFGVMRSAFRGVVIASVIRVLNSRRRGSDGKSFATA